jgi:hypothetical protein
MKTSDFRINVSSEKLNESLQRKFGGKIDINNFNDHELIRASKLIENKITEFKRSNFNATLDNDEFFKLKLMKDVIDTRMQEVFGESKKKNDGNLANNYPPYDKVTRGDVVAGRLGKDEMGGKNKKVKEAEKKTMSRAAKGNEKYGKDGMKALAKAGREGASKKKLDSIRKKHDNYNEGWKGGALGGLAAGALSGWNPWAMGGGYLLGSKAGDDVFGEDVDMGTKAARHAMLYRHHHHTGDLESAMHHKSMCAECGGMLEHDDLGECWMSHPHILEGQPCSVDEGWGKALGYGALGAGLGGLGAYALANPAALGGLGTHLIGLGGQAANLGGQGLEAAKGMIGNLGGGGADAAMNAAAGSDLGNLGTGIVPGPGGRIVGTNESQNKKTKGKASKMDGKKLMESDGSMCELAMHHAVEYRKSHKAGNLKHCEHHKKNVEECGGKLWHDGTGEVFFSHHGHRNGVPEIVKEFTIGGDHNISALGKLGSRAAGGWYGAMPGRLAGGALGGLVGGPAGAEIGSEIGSVGGALAGGSLAGTLADKLDAAKWEVGGHHPSPVPEDTETEEDEDTTEGKKMTPKEKKLAAKYPPKDKITRGDIITAAKEKKKTNEQAERMLKESIRFYLREGEEGKAEVIMAVKDMVDKFTGWSEDIAQMQANTAMEMADSIRDELGSDVSAQFTQVAGPALDSAFQAVKAAREALNSIVGVITGQGGAPMGAMPGAAPMGGMPGGAPGGMPGAAPMGGMPGGAGPSPEADEEEMDGKRAKRESVDRTRRIAKLLVGR